MLVLFLMTRDAAGFFANFGQAENNYVDGFEMARYDQDQLRTFFIFIFSKFNKKSEFLTGKRLRTIISMKLLIVSSRYI